MKNYGFSTGALALGDFRRGLSMLAGRKVLAVELSALRDHELPALVQAIGGLDLSGFEYVSVHAPSRFATLSEALVADLLSFCIHRQWPVVMHPDAIGDHGCWRHFGRLLCIENMDKRKPSGRTVMELDRHFKRLPEASLCLDLGHARQVDPTLSVARAILRSFGDVLTQIHLSELDARSHHEHISAATIAAVQEIQSLIPPCTIIIESRIPEKDIETELRMARACFSPQHKGAMPAMAL